MRVCVVGLGYIGLPTALIMAASGHEVIGVDYSEKVVSSLNAGKVTFEEEGLTGLFEQALKKDITFATDYPEAEMYIVAVPTPYLKESKKVDASFVASAVSSVLEVCNDGSIVVVESTVSPGTIDTYVRPLLENIGDKNVFLAHAPERIIPGNMLYELEHNDRTIGADSLEIAEQVKEVYASFCKGEIILTDIRSAEMSKVVENTFRDINIAFANELAKICRQDNLDVHEIIRIANHHPRVNILSPGPGVGGHCISVDPWFLVGSYPSLANLIWTARKTNDSMPEFVLQRTREIMDKNGISDISKVGFYGLTYKENVDDIRESPTLQLIDCMKSHLSEISAKFYDPFAADDLVPNQVHSLDDFLKAVDVVVIMVSHDELIKHPELLKDKIVFDTRHCIFMEGVERL